MPKRAQHFLALAISLTVAFAGSRTLAQTCEALFKETDVDALSSPGPKKRTEWTTELAPHGKISKENLLKIVSQNMGQPVSERQILDLFSHMNFILRGYE